MAKNHFDTIREQHHNKAKLLASGRSVSDVAHILDTSATALERLQRDPTFRDLIAHYRQSEYAPSAQRRFRYLCAA